MGSHLALSLQNNQIQGNAGGVFIWAEGTDPAGSGLTFFPGTFMLLGGQP